MNDVKSKWDLDASWGIGTDDYETLIKHVIRENVGIIVELGSGQSTFQLAHDFPDSALYSLESDAMYRKKNSRSLSVQGFPNANILAAPIKTVAWHGGVFTTYDISPLHNISKVDVLIIDGPVERLFPLGREAALYLLFDKCVQGAVIGLDDYHRESAKIAVKNWLTTFGNSLTLVEETSSFAVLRKNSECAHPKMSWQRRVQSVTAMASSIAARSKYTLSSITQGSKSRRK